MKTYLFKRMHKVVYSSTTHDLVNGENGLGLGVLGTLPKAPFFCPLRTQPLVVEGGKFLSLISMTAPSALITGSQRQPEVKGEWMSE